MPRHFAIHVLAVWLLADSTLVAAEAGAPAPPQLFVVSDPVPVDGVLVLSSESYVSDWNLRVQDAAGSDVPGTLTRRDTLLVFRPHQPLQAGQSYRIDYSAYGSPWTEQFTAVAASSSTLDLGVSLTFRELLQPSGSVCCTSGLGPTPYTVCLPAQAQTKQELTVTSKALPAPVQAGQLLAGLDIDGQVGPLLPWAPSGGVPQPVARNQWFETASQHCAVLHVLDLRTGLESVGSQSCASHAFEPNTVRYDLAEDQRFDVASCPVPPASHLQAWCDRNASTCQASACGFYGFLCRGEPEPPPDDAGVWMDAGGVTAIDAGGVTPIDAGVAAADSESSLGTPPASHDSGCSTGRGAPRHTLFAICLAALALRPRPKRNRPR